MLGSFQAKKFGSFWKGTSSNPGAYPLPSSDASYQIRSHQQQCNMWLCAPRCWHQSCRKTITCTGLKAGEVETIILLLLMWIITIYWPYGFADSKRGFQLLPTTSHPVTPAKKLSFETLAYCTKALMRFLIKLLMNKSSKTAVNGDAEAEDMLYF